MGDTAWATGLDPCVALFLSAGGVQDAQFDALTCTLANNMCHPDTEKRYWLPKDCSGGLVYDADQVGLLLPADPVLFTVGAVGDGFAASCSPCPL